MHYEPTYASVSQHPVPDWYHDAKLGIFIHWGLYSVPAFAPNAPDLGETIAKGNWQEWFANNPYAEWYYNSLRIDGSPTQRYHNETYGADFAYFDFVSQFNDAVQAWDPNAWADLFHRAGARYVVPTTKHHDGFLLWPSRHPNPHRDGYHSQRDLIGELEQAVRQRGIHYALYYSGGIDWTFNPQVIQSREDMAAAVPQMPEYIEYADNHWRELTERYGTEILWNDIAYPAAADINRLFADYYNHNPEGLVNNRFRQTFEMDPETGELRSDYHFDFETPEYTSFDEIRQKKWESCRGIGHSFGYNRHEAAEQYLSEEELIHSFVDIVSKNGNLLLNVGPMADGTIPDLQVQRLEELGRWLDVNGEAIYGTRPWQRAEGRMDDGTAVRFTQRDGTLYAILLKQPSRYRTALENVRLRKGARVQLLGYDEPLEWAQDGDDVTLRLPQEMKPAVAYVLCIE